MLRIHSKARSFLPMLAAIVGLLFAMPALALTTGSLRISVTDQQGLPVPGVELSLSGDTLIGGTQVRVADERGQFLFVELLPGRYSLDATKPGFGGVSHVDIPISINREHKIDVKMVAGQVEEVEVIEKQDAVEVSNTTRGSVLTKEFLDRVPAGRSYQQAVQMAAGVTGQGGNPNISGGATNENTYMLDGANITDPVTGTFSVNFNFDAIQQIEVLLGGYLPEYGVSVGGIVNIVTESGTNNLEFDTGVYYTNGNLRPRLDQRITADGLTLAPTGFDSEFQSLQVSSKVSGPIIRDKAWFIVSYQHSRSIIALTGVPQARDFDAHYMLAKVTFQPTTEHRLSAFFQTDPTTIDNAQQGSPFVKAEAQRRQAQGGFVGNLRWQWFLSPEVNLDTAFTIQKSYLEGGSVPCTHNQESDRHQCFADEQEGELDWETPGRVGLFGAFDSVNWGIYDFDDRFRYQGSSRLSLLSIVDPLGGTHDFKFGVEGIQLVWDRLRGIAGNIQYFDANIISFDPATFVGYFWIETTGPIKFRTTASQYNMFVQDSYKPVSNLTINYGTRFDTFVIRNDIGDPVLSGALLGPRLFGAWDPWGDQKTKVATGWGRFNDTGRLGVASFTSQGNFGQKLYFGELFDDSQGSGFVGDAGSMADIVPSQNTNTSHGTLRNPRVDEIILTLEREVIEDVALFSSMSGKFTRYLFEPDEVNFIYDSDGSTVIGARRADFSQQYLRLRTPALAKRDYFQWDMGVRKVSSRRWAAQATYTYTQSIGSTTNAISGSFINDPQTQYNYGPLNTDLRHVITAVGFWDLPTDPWTQTIGFFFRYLDGFPEERLYWAENTGSGFGGYSLRIRPRGTYLRFNPYWFLSLTFRQAIDVRKGQLQLEAQIENIFNNRAPDIPNFGLIDRDNRLLTVSRQDPLSFLVGVSYEF